MTKEEKMIKAVMHEHERYLSLKQIEEEGKELLNEDKVCKICLNRFNKLVQH